MNDEREQRWEKKMKGAKKVIQILENYCLKSFLFFFFFVSKYRKKIYLFIYFHNFYIVDIFIIGFFFTVKKNLD